MFSLRATSLLRAGRTFSNFAPTSALTLDGAKVAMEAATAEATANGFPVTIAVTDTHGVPIMLHRLSGAAPFSAEVAIGKARTAALFKRETALLEGASNVADGKARTALLSAPYILMEGGVPILVEGECVGAVGVSGVLPGQDAQVAKAGVSALE